MLSLRNKSFVAPHLQRYRYDELPPHLKGNPYIVTGYRAYLDHRSCLKTICSLHNEYVNTWTHLVGFVWAFVTFWSDQTIRFPAHEAAGGDTMDRIMFAAYLLGVQACMLSSGCFHLFLPQSEVIYKRWLALDLLGITLGIVSGYFPGVYFGFYCLPTFRTIYAAMTAVIFVFNIAVQCHPKFLSPHWALRRVLLFSLTLGFGLVPLSHWASINYDNQDEISLFVPKVMGCYLFMAIGVSFYLSYWPERICPGTCDIWGHSHQWWHIMVLVTLVWWYNSSVTIWEYRVGNPCPA
eukprot:TRINITY_DN7114_c0_g1_i2.p1 TRINITY_DN7114_c0_g1~~TRINITY_DN7114_c0_g1_i2.p1  ORF type:complete len:294 (+),score=47.30 TRINITY_DN7114_c0_g1_i2:85-966(+)